MTRGACLFLLLSLLPLPAAAGPARGAERPPPDFPRFLVPRREGEMAALRRLFWLHYPGAGPKSTLWDAWLAEPALWPAVFTGGRADAFRKRWREALSARRVDPEGYVSTHQHRSFAHPEGWPFPLWTQGRGGYGWHFSFEGLPGPPWRPKKRSTRKGWGLEGAADRGIGKEGWNLELTAPRAALVAPARRIDTFQAPFLQLRWKAEGLDGARPYVEWKDETAPAFGPGRRMYFSPPRGGEVTCSVIPLHRHPAWRGTITGLRIGFGNPRPGAKVTVQAFFTTYDTRHNVNGPCFVRGCAAYFRWTGDLEFLRRNANRMRAALRHVMTVHHALERKVVYTDWVGHDGRSGIARTPEGKKRLRWGHGIGNNYWDLLPFGCLDGYATVQYYDALRVQASLERAIRAHPEWNVPSGAPGLEPAFLERHAAEVKEEGNRLFWNEEAGRFVACIDADGTPHDYGYTFLNTEAVACGFATEAHARAIMAWMKGDREVAGDTARGAEIYHWRFGPRASTRRNVEWYMWAWSAPEKVPWGGQVQDGGAVLGFSYYDLMARLRVLGPDDAWARLREILDWFREVEAAGGYRRYYDGTREGTLQGGGTAGGLGMDKEFFESVLLPQVVLRGFLGFRALGDGFALAPRLPRDWPSLTVDRIRWHDRVLSVRADRRGVEVRAEGDGEEPCLVRLPEGYRPAAVPGRGGGGGLPVPAALPSGTAWRVEFRGGKAVRWERKG